MLIQDEIKNYRLGSLRYGISSANPRGITENTTKCIEEVSEPGRYGSFHRHQCNRKRGFGYKNLFCKQHAKRYSNLEQEEVNHE